MKKSLSVQLGNGARSGKPWQVDSGGAPVRARVGVSLRWGQDWVPQGSSTCTLSGLPATTPPKSSGTKMGWVLCPTTQRWCPTKGMWVGLGNLPFEEPVSVAVS